MEADSFSTRFIFALGRYVALGLLDITAILITWCAQKFATYIGATAYNMPSMLSSLTNVTATIFLAQLAWHAGMEVVCLLFSAKHKPSLHWGLYAAVLVLIAETLSPPSSFFALLLARGNVERILIVTVITRTLEVYGITAYFIYRCARYDAWPLCVAAWRSPWRPWRAAPRKSKKKD